MKNAACSGAGAWSRSANELYGCGTTSQVGAIARMYRNAATFQARPIGISPVTRGRPGLFVRSISRSAIWLTMFEAAFMAEAQRDPIATVRATAQVTRRAG